MERNAEIRLYMLSVAKDGKREYGNKINSIGGKQKESRGRVLTRTVLDAASLSPFPTQALAAVIHILSSPYITRLIYGNGESARAIQKTAAFTAFIRIDVDLPLSLSIFLFINKQFR